MSWTDGLLPQLRPYFQELVRVAQQKERGVRVSSAYRSITEQRRLYAAFLAGRNKYPVAPPGSSLHEQGRAIDLSASPETLRWLGQVWRTWGGTWSPSDDIHFQA